MYDCNYSIKCLCGTIVSNSVRRSGFESHRQKCTWSWTGHCTTVIMLRNNILNLIQQLKGAWPFANGLSLYTSARLFMAIKYWKLIMICDTDCGLVETPILVVHCARMTLCEVCCSMSIVRHWSSFWKKKVGQFASFASALQFWIVVLYCCLVSLLDHKGMISFRSFSWLTL